MNVLYLQVPLSHYLLDHHVLYIPEEDFFICFNEFVVMAILVYGIINFNQKRTVKSSDKIMLSHFVVSFQF